MKHILPLLFLVLGQTYFAAAQAPKYSNDFLAIGVSARAMSLGSGTVTGVSDATASYWNPSALLNTNYKWQGSLMHASYFGGIANYDFAAVSHQLDERNAIGISFIRLGIDDIQNTLNLYDANGNINYNNISTFSAADYAFGFSYAHMLKNAWKVGATAKVIRRVIGPFAQAWGFGFDIGLSRSWDKLEFGIMARDVTTTFNVWSFNTRDFAAVFAQTGNELPENSLEITLPRILAGIAYRFQLPKDIGIRPEVNLELLTDGPRNGFANVGRFALDPRAGVEIDYTKLVFLRFGVNNLQRTPDFGGEEKITIQPNLGVGLHFKRFGVDYAITNVGDRSRTFFSNVLSLNVSL